MERETIYLSTIDPQAQTLARAHGLGLEIAEFCTAWNLEEHWQETEASVRQKLAGIPRRVLHGPYNELFPCAIDPRAREVARLRYRQALAAAVHFGADKVVLHGGYNPWLYYPVWYREQSAQFWREFAQEIPEGITLCLENVLEPEPELLLDIVRAADSPRLGLCLDVGHVNAYSRVPVLTWLERCAPDIQHFHIHNNAGDADTHSGLTEGTIPMEPLLRAVAEKCPEATVTLELPQGEGSVRWLEDHIFTEECTWKRN